MFDCYEFLFLPGIELFYSNSVFYPLQADMLYFLSVYSYNYSKTSSCNYYQSFLLVRNKNNQIRELRELLQDMKGKYFIYSHIFPTSLPFGLRQINSDNNIFFKQIFRIKLRNLPVGRFGGVAFVIYFSQASEKWKFFIHFATYDLFMLKFPVIPVQRL